MNKLFTLFFTLIASTALAQVDSVKLNNIQQVKITTETKKNILQANWVDLDINQQLSYLTVEEISINSFILVRYQPIMDSILIDTLALSLSSPNIIYSNIDNKNGIDIIEYHDDQINIYTAGIITDKPIYSKKQFLLDTISIETIQIGDLDQNGSKDLLLTGDVNGNKKNIVGRFKDDSIEFNEIDINTEFTTLTHLDEVSPLKILSFSNDSLFIHGFDREDQIVQDTVIYLEGTITSFAQGDVNDNTSFDYLLVIEDNSGQVGTFILYDLNSLVKIDNENYTELFVGDFNSDGLSDLYASNEEQTVIFKQNSENNFEKQLLNLQVNSQATAIGDMDRDGDLDFGTFNKESNTLNLISNETGNNLAPEAPDFFIFFQGNQSIALFWPEAIDDYSSILTYDLDIKEKGNVNDYISGTFESDSSFRLKTVHGNQNTQRFAEYFNLPAGEFDIQIQSVDNSYFAKRSSCLIGGFSVCESVPESTINICKGSSITFNNNGRESHWYSSNNGYMGQADTLTYLASNDDILYTVAINAENCDDYMVWHISVDEFKNFITLPDLVGCEGENYTFDFTAQGIEFDSLKWKMDSTYMNGLIINSEFTINKKIPVQFYKGQCTYNDTIDIIVSKPIIFATPRFAEVMSGESVQLNVTPDFEYNWSPSTGLNNNSIHNPIATPINSTTYFVTVTDSIGCSAIDSVSIAVRQIGFMPELFTPNNDGNNDFLRVHQLTSVQELSFKIMDKRGNTVFQTTSINELINGWDGTHNGREIPSGTYVWKVKGKSEEGEPILINGGQKGVVNLVR